MIWEANIVAAFATHIVTDLLIYWLIETIVKKWESHTLCLIFVLDSKLIGISFSDLTSFQVSIDSKMEFFLPSWTKFESELLTAFAGDVVRVPNQSLQPVQTKEKFIKDEWNPVIMQVTRVTLTSFTYRMLNQGLLE